MKRLLLLIAGSIPFFAAAQGQKVTSVQNGNASSFTTWDCLCIPIDGDTIIVKHNVTLDVNYAYTMGGIEVDATGQVNGNDNARLFGVSGGYFLNNGIVNIAYIYHGAGSFVNNGNLTASRNLGIDVGVTNQNNGVVNVLDTFLLNTGASFINTNSLTAPEIGVTGSVINSGTIQCDNYWNTGTLQHNAGAVSIAQNIWNTGNINVNAPMNISGDIFNAENFTVNYYTTARNLYNGDSIGGTANFVNDAVVSLGQDLQNSETISGNGDFCVQDSTLNIGTITGNLNICDLTGGNFDFNVGVISPTVTFCQPGCAIGMEESSAAYLRIYPNPASYQTEIRMPYSSDWSVRIYDATGRLMMESTVQLDRLVVSTEGWESGIYLIYIENPNLVLTEKLIVE